MARASWRVATRRRQGHVEQTAPRVRTPPTRSTAEVRSGNRGGTPEGGGGGGGGAGARPAAGVGAGSRGGPPEGGGGLAAGAAQLHHAAQGWRYERGAPGHEGRR